MKMIPLERAQKEFPFHWVEHPQMHTERRKQILKAHPEVVTLFGTDPMSAVWIVILAAALLALSLVIPRDGWLLATVLAVLVGAPVGLALSILIHDGGHYLMFKKKWANDLFMLIANIPIPFPFAMVLRPYHSMHHQFLGEWGRDVDMPTPAELPFIHSKFWMVKATWLSLLLPLKNEFTLPMKVKKPLLQIVNFGIAIAVNGLIIWATGSLLPTYFMTISSLLFTGPHLVGARVLQEHHSLNGTSAQDTFSYYGPMNYVLFNVGHHTEHHDFPTIPWSRLHLLRKMAPEFYNTLEYHTSYTQIVRRFLFDRSVGVFSRVVRKSREVVTP